MVQVYAPTTDYDDKQIEEFYTQLQDIVNRVDKIIQGDWNAKVGADAQADWKDSCGPFCNATTNERGLCMLEFANYNNKVFASTSGEQRLQQSDRLHHGTETVPIRNQNKDVHKSGHRK